MENTDRRQTNLKQKFKFFYKANLCSKYSELEKQRKIYLQKFKKTISLFTAGFLVWCGLCCTGIISREIYSSEILARLYAVYFIIAGGCCSIIISAFKRETKALVMDKILSFWGTFKYSDNKNFSISESLIKKSKLFNDFNTQEIDDCFQGQYNNTEITVSEQKLAMTTKTSKGSQEEGIFKGILINLIFNKDFSGQTVVKDKKIGLSAFFNLPVLLLLIFASTLCAVVYSIIIMYKTNPANADLGFYVFPFIPTFIYCAFAIPFIVKKMRRKGYDSLTEKVILEDTRFNKKWSIHSDNQIEARYILTTALMERMLNLKKLFKGSALDFSFFDNRLIIAIHSSKDWFETTSLFKSALDYNKVEEVICQCDSIFSIVDILKLANPPSSNETK